MRRRSDNPIDWRIHCFGGTDGRNDTDTHWIIHIFSLLREDERAHHWIDRIVKRNKKHTKNEMEIEMKSEMETTNLIDNSF